jgi:hypothetical protein
MSSSVYNKFLKSFPNADANIQVANINSFLKNKELQTYTPISLNNGVENVKATNNMITVTKNFDVLLTLGGRGKVSADSLLQIGDLLYIGGDFSVEYKGVTHKHFISFNRVTGEINGFNGLGNSYDLSEGGIIEHNGAIYVLFVNLIDNLYLSTLYKITNNVPTIIETPPNAYISKMAFDQNGKFYICSTVNSDFTSTIYEYSENSTWTSITSSIPGFKCRGFAFDTNNVLYAVCNTSAKKCLYRKALDSNQWTPLVNGEIRRYDEGLDKKLLFQPNIIINKYNKLYIYGTFTEINNKYNAYIAEYNENLQIFDNISIFSNAGPITSVVFDENGDLFTDGRNNVKKRVFEEWTDIDINYTFNINYTNDPNNDEFVGYSILLDDNEMIIPYYKQDISGKINTNIVSYKFISKQSVITDRQLQYIKKTETTFSVNEITTICQTNRQILFGCLNAISGNSITDIIDVSFIKSNVSNSILKFNILSGNIKEAFTDLSGVPALYTESYSCNIYINNTSFYIINNNIIIVENDYYLISQLIINNKLNYNTYTPPLNSAIAKFVVNDDKNVYSLLVKIKWNEFVNGSYPINYGIYVFSIETNTWTNISNSITDFYCYSFCLDKNDNLYAVGYTGDNCLFIKNKEDNNWLPLASGNILNVVGEKAVVDLVSDNNDELYIIGDFVKIGSSDIAYIAKYNKTLKTFESVGDVLRTQVEGIAFDSKNNVYITQRFEPNVKTLVNNVWKYVNVCDRVGWSVSRVINITDDVLVAAYLPSSIGGESLVSYDLKNKKRTYPGWKTTVTKETGNALIFNEIGQSVQIFTDPNDMLTNGIILNKSEGVILSDSRLENLNNETRSNGSKGIKDIKSKNMPINMKSIRNLHL